MTFVLVRKLKYEQRKECNGLEAIEKKNRGPT